MANRIITITGTGSSFMSYVTINGTKHYSAKSLTVADGTEITCTLSRASGITVNGTAQASPYTFTVSADTTIALTTSSITVTYDAAGSGGGSGHKTKVGSTAYDIESGRIKKGSTVYELEKGTVKVGSTAYDILFQPNTVAASEIVVGKSVFLSVNGAMKEFLVVHQGNPDTSSYDSSCNGTWLLMKDIYEKRAWHSSATNRYSSSSIHTYLKGTFYNLFDADTKAAIKSVKIPYKNGTGTSGSIATGTNGLSTYVFLLSAVEVGVSAGTITDEGSFLSYFNNCSATGADSKRVAKLNNTATAWWLRSPGSANTSCAGIIKNTGAPSATTSVTDTSTGVRPALILSSDAQFNADTMEFVGTE